MGFPLLGMILGAVGALGSASAASNAADQQTNASLAGIAAQERTAAASLAAQKEQWAQIQANLQPFVSSGTNAMNMQADLAGANGPHAQQQAIAMVQNSPELAAMVGAGENSIRQNAAATGGLRGGNTQAALAQFAPQMLAQQIGTQFDRYGALAGQGLSAAAGMGTAGQNFANAVGNINTNLGTAQAQGYGDVGSYQAGKTMAVGQAFNRFLGGVASGADQWQRDTSWLGGF